MSKRNRGKKCKGAGNVAAAVEAIRRRAQEYKVRNQLVPRSRKKK